MAGEATKAETVKTAAEKDGDSGAPAPSGPPGGGGDVDAPPAKTVTDKAASPAQSVEPLKRLWLTLLLVLLALTALLSGAAAIRRNVWRWPPSPRLVIVPKAELPAYHQVQTTDVTPQIVFAGGAEAGTLKKAGDIVGRYTLKAMRKGEPIKEEHLGPTVNSAQFSGKVAAEVLSSGGPVTNHRLKAGDFVDITFGPQPQGGGQSQPFPGASFQNVLVLDVRRIERPEPAAPGQPMNDYLLILALPPERHAELAAQVANKTPFTLLKKELTR